MFHVSACLWSLPALPPDSLGRVRAAGFTLTDLRPDCWRGITISSELQPLGMQTGCAGLLPQVMAPGVSLDLLATGEAGRVLPYLSGAVSRAARLGARRAYIISPQRPLDSEARYIQSMRQLAAMAEAEGVMLCLEPTPGRSVPNDAAALRIIEQADHPNLYVLIDLGHCLITREAPAESVRNAGERLGYVHVDDNDGKSDLHLPLFEGVLQRHTLDDFLRALHDADYYGGMGIELKSNGADPMAGLAAARDYILRWETGTAPPDAADSRSESIVPDPRSSWFLADGDSGAENTHGERGAEF